MRTIIAGCRHHHRYQDLLDAIDHIDWIPTVILSGTAKGVDKLGQRWAVSHYLRLEKHPADWRTYGKSAGYHRNTYMANHAEALIALWDGKSKGTKHMISIAKRSGLKVYVHKI